MRGIYVVAGVGVALSCGGCHRQVTVKNVDEVIHVCKTNVKTVRDEFGPPDRIGEMNGLVTNEYVAMSGRMIVGFVHDVVVNVVVNPAGMVKLQNRCTKRTADR